MATPSPSLQFSDSLIDGKSAQKQHVHFELSPYHITLTLLNSSSVSWPYSNILWTEETIPFPIEHQFNTPGEVLKTMVVEDPNFYENCRRVAPYNFSA